MSERKRLSKLFLHAVIFNGDVKYMTSYKRLTFNVHIDLNLSNEDHFTHKGTSKVNMNSLPKQWGGAVGGRFFEA